MSVCEQCSKPSKLLFICPKCGGRHCREHKLLEDHNCVSLQKVDNALETESIEEIEIEDEAVFQEAHEEVITQDLSEETLKAPEPFIQETLIEPEIVEEQVTEDIVLEKTYEAEETVARARAKPKDLTTILESTLSYIENTKLLAPLLVGVLIGVILTFSIINLNLIGNSSPELDPYFLELKANFANLTSAYEELKLSFFNLEAQMKELESELTEKTKEYNVLEANYTVLLKAEKDWLDNIENQVSPSIFELDIWLTIDDTDSLETSDSLSQLHQAMILTLKARINNWDLGIITLRGNFTYANDYTINTVLSTDGIVYIDPSTDETWSYNGREIGANETWTIGDQRVHITEIKLIK